MMGNLPGMGIKGCTSWHCPVNKEPRGCGCNTEHLSLQCDHLQVQDVSWRQGKLMLETNKQTRWQHKNKEERRERDCFVQFFKCTFESPISSWRVPGTEGK